MKRERGFALMEVVFGATILLVAAAAFMGMEFQRRRGVAKAIVQGESIDALRNIEQLMDCRKTFANVASDPTRVADCASAATKTTRRYVDIRDAADQVLLAKFDPANEEASTRMGKLLLRARCVSQDGFNGLLVEYRKVVDTMDKQWKTIADNVPIACGP